VSFALYAAIYLFTIALSLIWRIPIQSGFAFLSVHQFLMSVTVLSYLMLLTVATHPVLAVLIAILLSEDVFYAIRTGLLAAIRNTGGNILLPLLEKLTFVVYLLLPMYSPHAETVNSVSSAMRVSSGEWSTLLYTLFYVFAIAAICYLLSLKLLRRKNYM
jgi:hypothetical protein